VRKLNLHVVPNSLFTYTDSEWEWKEDSVGIRVVSKNKKSERFFPWYTIRVMEIDQL
jgi:hypothetical protein